MGTEFPPDHEFWFPAYHLARTALGAICIDPGWNYLVEIGLSLSELTGFNGLQKLEQQLAASLLGDVPPSAALLFACAGRGRNMFGVSGHDSGTLRRMIDIPVAGMFSAGEIAPIQGATFVHGYSSVFGLIRPRAA